MRELRLREVTPLAQVCTEGAGRLGPHTRAVGFQLGPPTFSALPRLAVHGEWWVGGVMVWLTHQLLLGAQPRQRPSSWTVQSGRAMGLLGLPWNPKEPNSGLTRTPPQQAAQATFSWAQAPPQTLWQPSPQDLASVPRSTQAPGSGHLTLRVA